MNLIVPALQCLTSVYPAGTPQVVVLPGTGSYDKHSQKVAYRTYYGC